VSPTPTVYFIDDSATMREVIKIAFRRENINVVAYNDAASALGQIEQSQPDVVISDVIMPDKDGYEVCQFIKQNPTLNRIPVILMSGVVNRTVAEKAFAVKADELIRKPFQPQDLITRVKHLLKPGAAVPSAPMPAPATASAAAALSSIFQAQPAAARRPIAAPVAQATFTPVPHPPSVAAVPPPSMPARPAEAARSGSSPQEIQKMKIEILRLEGLVKKLQSELQAEREYSRALEEHIKTLQDAD